MSVWYIWGWGSILFIGCSRHVVEALLCARCGVADEWLDSATRRQRERARGVRAGAVGSGRGDRPGDGGLPTWTAEYCGGCMCAGMCRRHVHACVACGVFWEVTRLSEWASSGGVCVVHVGMGPHPVHRLQPTCGRGFTVRTVWCCRLMARHRCTSPAITGMWSACGRCWIGARRSTRQWWVAQPGCQCTAGAVCVRGCAGGTCMNV